MDLKDVDLRDCYRRWKNGLGEYRCFFRSTPFVSLKTYENFTLENKENQLDDNIINIILEELDEKYFIIVDLDINEILDISLELNNKYNIKPILNMNLLFNNFGLIGDKINITKLINTSIKLENKICEKYVMMIPYDRYIEDIDIVNIKDRLNNQYAIGFDDLPDEEFIKELGYRGIKIITKSKVKEDLMDYINYIKNNVEVKLIKVE